MADKHRSIDDLIASYLEAVDNGMAPDWETYVADAPELRQQFAQFLQLSAGVDALAVVREEAGFANARQLPMFRQPAGVGEAEAMVHPPHFGHFVLDRILGRGGMGLVYVAQHRHSGERVALKLLRYRDHNHSMYQERLRREAVAISSLEHPHIVSIVDSGVIDGSGYLATELIDGIGVDQAIELLNRSLDLSEGLVASKTPVSGSPVIRCVEGLKNDRFQNTAKLGAEIAEALHAAHQKQVIHRDVKPSNILIDTTGHAWLTDFGLAALGDGFTELTQTGDFLGTPAYMSPEQTGGARRGVIDHRTDIYSLGATLYELATGSKPFAGSRHQILNDIVQGNIRPASKLEPRMPIELQGIIARAMATHPNDRYPTASAMADDLRAVWQGAPVRVKQTGVIVHTIRWCERNPWAALATLVGVMLSVAAAFAVQVWNGTKLQSMNVSLARVNEQLVQTNKELDASERRLSRELYVADVAAAYDAFNDGNIPAARGLLARYGKNAQLASHRGTAWHLLNTLTAAPASVELCRHGGAARQLAIAQDGSFGLSAGHDGFVRRFSIVLPAAATDDDGPHGDEARRSRENGPVESGPAFEIGGKLDALAMDSAAEVFITGKNIPDGYNQIGVFELNSGKTVGGNLGLWNSVESIAVSPSDRWIASADRYQDVVVHDRQGTIRGRWNTESRNEAIAFVDDRQLLAIVQDDQNIRWLELWDIDTDQTRRSDCPFQVQLVAISRLADTEPPRSVVAAEGNAIGLLSWPDLKLMVRSETIVGRIRCIDISRDGGTIVAGCDEGTVVCWRVASGSADRQLSEPQVIEAGDQAITDIKLLPAAPQSDPTTENSPIYFVTASTSGLVECWRLPGRIVETVETAPVHELIDRPLDSQYLYTANQDGSISRLDVQTMTPERLCQTDLAFTGRGVFSPDGKRLIASVNDGLVDLDLEMSRPPKTWPVANTAEPCADLIVCGDQVVALFNTHLIAYDQITGDQRRQVGWLPSGSSQRLCLHPDGMTVLVITHQAVFRLEASRLVLVEQAANEANCFNLATFSSDGKLLATAHPNGSIQVRPWVPADGTAETPAEATAGATAGARLMLTGHQSGATSLWFLDADRILASGAFDGTMRFWDLASGRTLGSLKLRAQANRLYPLPGLSTILTYRGNLGEISAWRWTEK